MFGNGVVMWTSRDQHDIVTVLEQSPADDTTDRPGAVDDESHAPVIVRSPRVPDEAERAWGREVTQAARS